MYEFVCEIQTDRQASSFCIGRISKTLYILPEGVVGKKVLFSFPPKRSGFFRFQMYVKNKVLFTFPLDGS